MVGGDLLVRALWSRFPDGSGYNEFAVDKRLPPGDHYDIRAIMDHDSTGRWFRVIIHADVTESDVNLDMDAELVQSGSNRFRAVRSNGASYRIDWAYVSGAFDFDDPVRGIDTSGAFRLEERQFPGKGRQAWSE